jgi:hypothetical protein
VFLGASFGLVFLWLSVRKLVGLFPGNGGRAVDCWFGVGLRCGYGYGYGCGTVSSAGFWSSGLFFWVGALFNYFL